MKAKLFSAEPISVQSIPQFYQLINIYRIDQNYQFNCSCGRSQIISTSYFKKRPVLKCNVCKRKENGNSWTPETAKKKKLKWLNKTESEIKTIKEKAYKTNLSKYGNAAPLANPEIHKKWRTSMKSSQKGYVYEGYRFDSKLEINFYKHLKEDLGLVPEVDFQMQVLYPSQYFDGKVYRNTIVDFKVKDCWIELKGKQFFDKKGNAQWVWKNNKDYNYWQNRWEHKLSFLRKENIKILSSIEDIKNWNFKAAE